MISHTGGVRTSGVTFYKFRWNAAIAGSVRQQPFGFARQVINLRQNGVLQLGMISHPGIERTYAAHGGVQAVEELIGDTSGDFGAVAPRMQSSWATRTRLVFSTEARMVSQS